MNARRRQQTDELREASKPRPEEMRPRWVSGFTTLLLVAGLCTQLAGTPANATEPVASPQIAVVNVSTQRSDALAAQFCADEILDLVRLDGRLRPSPVRASAPECDGTRDVPGWLACSFDEQVPELVITVAVQVASGAYTLSVDFITRSGEQLRHEASVDGALTTLLRRCRRHGAATIRAIYGDILVSERIIDQPIAVSGDRSALNEWLRPRTAPNSLSGITDSDRGEDPRPRAVDDVDRVHIQITRPSDTSREHLDETEARERARDEAVVE